MGEYEAECQHSAEAARIALPISVRLKPVSTSTMTGNRGGGHRNAGDLRLGPWPADNVVGDQQNTGIGRGEAEGTDADARPEFPAHHIGIDFGAPARKVRRTTPKPARNFTQGARGRPTRLPATAPREQADLPHSLELERASLPSLQNPALSQLGRSLSGSARICAMTMPKVERRLAAILAADVARYSQLMGIDEVGTLAALKGHRRERIDPAIARHRGRIVKTTGDGLLAEFASVVDAVSCAVAIQRAMLAFNAGIHIDRQIVLRIGINIGDVIIDGADIFGDGVNVAARLEALCEPGGICISRSANEQVRDRLALRFADLGEQTVKNIARAVGVFGLAAKDIAALSEEELPQTEATALVRPPRWNRAAVAATAAVLSAAMLGAGGWWAYHGRTAASSRSYTMGELPRMSVAVLPFENLGADAKDDHLADGITADLTTDLSHIPDVIVVARDSPVATRARLRMSVGLARNWVSATWSMAAYRGSATHSESTLG